MPTVRQATPDEFPAVGAALAAAFVDDPLWAWMSPPSTRWRRRADRWFAAEAAAHARHGGLVLVDEDVRGVAVWAPPARWRATPAQVARIALPSLRLFRWRLPRSLRTVRALEEVHPHQPDHWYLAYLGTDPAHQGHGVGGALVRAVTERCDAEGLGAYLESSKEDNLAFYARHGFASGSPVGASGGPQLWPMWREARP